MLRDDRADVALLRTPFAERGLDYESLVTEPHMVALSAAHRLAGRRRLTLADLENEPCPRWMGADDATAR